MKFIDRKVELNALDDFYKSREAALLVLYGRRCVGKTALLNRWLTQRRVSRSLFWTATTSGADYQSATVYLRVMALQTPLNRRRRCLKAF